MINNTTIDMGNGKVIEIETGKMANLANGSCTLRMGDTVLFVAACSGSARDDADFFPLQVDYREKYTAAGRFPGGYIKREGRPSEKEILTCRVTDRPLRPLFPKGFYDEVQVQALLLSADGVNDADVLCMLGSSVALCLSDLPFGGPIGALRVGLIDGKFIANPTNEEMAASSLDLIYAGLEDKVIMIEGEADECSEKTLREAMDFANEMVKIQIKSQLELQAKAGRPKKTPSLCLVPENIENALTAACATKIDEVCVIPGKEDRLNALDSLFAEASEVVKAEITDVEAGVLVKEMKKCYDDLTKNAIRKAILERGYRPDGRGADDLRPLSAEIDTIPIVHGASLFSRGETQALVITTLGGSKDTENQDSITGEFIKKPFYLHYNFPNYSVGDVGRIGGTSRREIGHGNLAERSLKKVMPKDFPYSVRCVSEVMASNGSTSMASVCGGSLSLMAAGVPIKAPVAGISCGLVTDDSKKILLTDILGAEDHFGDMDFKVCGTKDGITGFQLDLKLPGISLDLLDQAMEKTLNARYKILDVMNGCIDKSRESVSQNAPQYVKLKVNPEKIGMIIGPGGKNIKALTENSGASIDISDDGTVNIFAPDGKALSFVKDQIEGMTSEAEIGKVYKGLIKTVKDFGAFVEILPGQEGLLHISELADYRVQNVTDLCKEGETVSVKVLDIDGNGRIRLSRKAALADMD